MFMLRSLYFLSQRSQQAPCPVVQVLLNVLCNYSSLWLDPHITSRASTNRREHHSEKIPAYFVFMKHSIKPLLLANQGKLRSKIKVRAQEGFNKITLARQLQQQMNSINQLASKVTIQLLLSYQGIDTINTCKFDVLFFVLFQVSTQ